jgi:hypothetical protein
MEDPEVFRISITLISFAFLPNSFLCVSAVKLDVEKRLLGLLF